ncbi:MAG: dihydrofolate synthase/folylpolyglutamate synthase [Limisphaerales bacterium]
MRRRCSSGAGRASLPAGFETVDPFEIGICFEFRVFKTVVTYSEAIQFLYDLQLFGAKLGLENPRQLARLAGDPQEGLRFIHVAGTNGKGSTCAMLDRVYRAAGLRVGLFTSPHLVEFRERIRIDGQMISEAELIQKTEKIRELLAQFKGPSHPTFFEVVVVIALLCFADAKCDLVIWETGLGGRLDATNIVTPLASVITNVHLDHQEWLGETLEEIATEKAGIIKPGIPVVTGATDERHALTVIREIAAALSSPATCVTDAALRLPPLSRLQLALLGKHQRRNAALALATINSLQATLPVSDKAVISGLQSARLAGRFQEITTDDGRTIVLDGAHNEAGVDALIVALAERFAGKKPAFVLGMMGDKAWREMSGKLATCGERVVLTPVASHRTAKAEELAQACRAANPSATISVAKNLPAALESVADEPLVVVTGSLHFLGEAMEALGLSGGPEVDEKGLNDYAAA